MIVTTSAGSYADLPPAHRRIATVVGLLFFFQFITFLVGSSLIQKYLDGEASRGTLTVGVALEMCAGLAVVAIGLLMYRVLKVVDGQLALGYPAMRILEFAVSAMLATYPLTQLEVIPNDLLWVYLPTAVGGLILNYLLFTSRMVPRAISVLGFIGYSLLLVVVPLGLMGIVDVRSGVGLAMQMPGGLYEFVVLPIWLIARGLRAPARNTARGVPMESAPVLS
jgi:hypothetical protein